MAHATTLDYSVPSMKEVEAIEPNGFKVASLFSGCGGSSLGYRMSGFKVAYANEFVAKAQQAYRLNHPNTHLDTRDVRVISPEDILEAAEIGIGELDILDGSPPCASFSSAGVKDKAWGSVKGYSSKKQRVDDLFFEYARILEGLKPKTFVAENVRGLVQGVSKGYFKEILGALRGCGYRVNAKVLDAQWLGVPQHRERLIFVGVREDLDIDPVHPLPMKHRYSVKDVIPEATKVRFGSNPPRYRTADLPSPTIVQSDYSRTETAQMSGGGFVEVEEQDGELVRRKFSIEELKLVCGFPSDFQLNGTPKQNWERLGRAVPPPMMAAISGAIRDQILFRCNAA